MKFCFRIGNTDAQTVEAICEGLNIDEARRYLATQKKGTRMHLVIRPRPGFDVEAKRNYFHGPMLTWICKEVHKIGIPASREQMKEEFKKRFILGGIDKDGKVKSLADTLEVMVEGDMRSPEQKYGEFLTDIRHWCMDVLGSEPPQPDQVDCGEEINECATPEKMI
jgi:hypothetical protein